MSLTDYQVTISESVLAESFEQSNRLLNQVRDFLVKEHLKESYYSVQLAPLAPIWRGMIIKWYVRIGDYFHVIFSNFTQAIGAQNNAVVSSPIATFIGRYSLGCSFPFTKQILTTPCTPRTPSVVVALTTRSSEFSSTCKSHDTTSFYTWRVGCSKDTWHLLVNGTETGLWINKETYLKVHSVTQGSPDKMLTLKNPIFSIDFCVPKRDRVIDIASLPSLEVAKEIGEAYHKLFIAVNQNRGEPFPYDLRHEHT